MNTGNAEPDRISSVREIIFRESENRNHQKFETKVAVELLESVSDSSSKMHCDCFTSIVTCSLFQRDLRPWAAVVGIRISRYTATTTRTSESMAQVSLT